MAVALLTPEFLFHLQQSVGSEVENREPRVRTCVVDLLEWLSRLQGTSVYQALEDDITTSILRNFTRDFDEVVEDEGVEADPRLRDAAAPADADSVASFSSARSGKPRIAHDTVGWKALESSIRAMRAAVTGCGRQFITAGCLTAQLRDDVIPRAVVHVNRFVREAVFFLINAVVEAAAANDLSEMGFEEPLVDLLSKGLGDNWSQVRFASSVATRSFMLKIDPSHVELFNAALIPRMCLNRYYVAEGVKLYSQESWRLVMGTRGPAVVGSVINEVVAYYISQSDADNHAVREAACYCIAELAHKVDKGLVSPHVPALLAALIVCFRDESWPVRDAACTASGRFVSGFMVESLPFLDDLYTLWLEHVGDPIWSVREDAAVAVGEVVRAYGEPALARVLPALTRFLAQAKDQPNDSKLFGDLSNSTSFGVAKRARDNDPSVHTGQQVYSCGSLAPKLRKGGCMDHGYHRKSEPWEATDGAVYLLREIAQYRPDVAETFLPQLAEVARLNHFTHVGSLHETVWKQFPLIAQAVGAKVVKRHLDLFLEPLLECLSSHSRLAAYAAGDCVAALQKLIGPRIFAGRLTPEQAALIDSSPAVPREGVSVRGDLLPSIHSIMRTDAAPFSAGVGAGAPSAGAGAPSAGAGAASVSAVAD